MKDNIDFFTHDTDAGTHAKHKALIAQFGFEGYGRFWRLNEIIGRSPGCKLDISKRLYLNSLADDLKTSPDALATFIDFLATPDECGLLVVVDNCLMTDRTQENLASATSIREAARARRNSNKSNVALPSSNESQTSPYESKTSSDRRATRTTEEGEEGYKRLARSAHFKSWLLGWLRTERQLRKPEQFAAKIIAKPQDYPDILGAYTPPAPPPKPKPPPPTTCDLCGSTDIRNPTNGDAVCLNCQRMWTRTDGEWIPDPDTGKPLYDGSDFETYEDTR